MYGKAGEEDNNLCLFGVWVYPVAGIQAAVGEQQSVAQTTEEN